MIYHDKLIHVNNHTIVMWWLKSYRFEIVYHPYDMGVLGYAVSSHVANQPEPQARECGLACNGPHMIGYL